MIKMIDISSFIVDTLNSSTEFKDLCIEKIDKEFDYFINVDLSRVEVPLPYFAVVTFENQDDIMVKKEYRVQILLGIERQVFVKTNNVTEEPTARTIEELSLKAIELIKKEMRTYGINQEKNIDINYINCFVPNPDGESDLQMQIDMIFYQEKFVNN